MSSVPHSVASVPLCEIHLRRYKMMNIVVCKKSSTKYTTCIVFG